MTCARNGEQILTRRADHGYRILIEGKDAAVDSTGDGEVDVVDLPALVEHLGQGT